ncbi:MAG: MBL fold metallo-hydrolase [Weeksellaceae bacterium]|nr:MBL fold metallo-hydrolase [Weeksellaceae bacterium]
MAWFLGIVAVIAMGIGVFMNSTHFGKHPRGERLEKIKLSENYRDGEFHNRIPVKQPIDDQPFILSMWEFLTIKTEHLTPESPLPVVQTNLHTLSPDEDVMIWFGHSSLFLQTDSKRFLVDPVFVSASPVAGFNRAFKMSYTYKPEDFPAIDYLIVTHEHWDHLDYYTIQALKDRVGHIICPLGVGSHFEHWGIPASKITELDWFDSTDVASPVQITAWPARHFSGRGLRRNKTLWAGYVLETKNSGNIYISGDTGYDIHFTQLKEKFDTIDWAILENGQFNEKWKEIHIMPDDLVKAIEEFQPKNMITVHHSKYALARHPWYYPLEKMEELTANKSLELLTPKMGEKIHLKDSVHNFQPWWKEYMQESITQ